MIRYRDLEHSLDAYADMKRALCADAGGPTDLCAMLECVLPDESPIVVLVPDTSALEDVLRAAVTLCGPFVRLRFLSEVYLRTVPTEAEARTMARGDLRRAHENGDMRVQEALSGVEFSEDGTVEVMLWRRTAYDDHGQPTWPDPTEVLTVQAHGHLVDAVQRALA